MIIIFSFGDKSEELYLALFASSNEYNFVQRNCFIVNILSARQTNTKLDYQCDL